MSRVFLIAVSSLITMPALAADGPIIDRMDALSFTAPKDKGRAELVDGKFGKAIRFSFEKDARSVFFSRAIRGDSDWDQAAGISFWVRGDGPTQFAGLELIYDDDYSLRYDLCIPVKGKEWTKVTAAWDDFLPALPGPRSKPLGAGGNPPSKITGLWFGKWWYWGDYPAMSFAIDEIRIEPTIERDRTDYRPDGDPLARFRGKLKAGKPITIVAMGDSLTDPRHHANRAVNWPEVLAKRLKAEYGSDATVLNPAIGGTQLRQNFVLMPRWLETTPEPDLVTIWFGGNDWDAGMRGPEFAAACADAVDRVRRLTRGKTDILLLTTCPSATRWDATMELGEACRTAARERKAGLCDVEAAFRAVPREERDRLYIADRVHLGPAGHQLVVDSIKQAVAGK
jgi:lysophospholipase L1-like esterase